MPFNVRTVDFFRKFSEKLKLLENTIIYNVNLFVRIAPILLHCPHFMILQSVVLKLRPLSKNKNKLGRQNKGQKKFHFSEETFCRHKGNRRNNKIGKNWRKFQ